MIVNQMDRPEVFEDDDMSETLLAARRGRHHFIGNVLS